MPGARRRVCMGAARAGNASGVQSAGEGGGSTRAMRAAALLAQTSGQCSRPPSMRIMASCCSRGSSRRRRAAVSESACARLCSSSTTARRSFGHVPAAKSVRVCGVGGVVWDSIGGLRTGQRAHELQGALSARSCSESCTAWQHRLDGTGWHKQGGGQKVTSVVHARRCLAHVTRHSYVAACIGVMARKPAAEAADTCWKFQAGAIAMIILSWGPHVLKVQWDCIGDRSK